MGKIQDIYFKNKKETNTIYQLINIKDNSLIYVKLKKKNGKTYEVEEINDNGVTDIKYIKLDNKIYLEENPKSLKNKQYISEKSQNGKKYTLYLNKLDNTYILNTNGKESSITKEQWLAMWENK